MGLESGTRIEDLDASNPATGDPVSEGDNHLRLIKTCVQGSFPSLGATAVSATATDLNKLNSTNINNEFARSFNGRTGAVLPAAGDYEIDDLSDVDTTTATPSTDDVLKWDGANWVPGTIAAPLYGMCLLTGTAGLGSTATRAYYMTTLVDNSIPVGLATVNNDSTNGFYIEAVVDCIVHIDFEPRSGGEIFGIAKDGSKTTGTDSQAAGVIRMRSDDADAMSASVTLAAGEQVWLNNNDAAGAIDTNAFVNALVQQVI